MVLIPRDSTRRSLALAARGGWRRSPPRAHSRRSLEVRRRSPLHAPLARSQGMRPRRPPFSLSLYTLDFRRLWRWAPTERRSPEGFRTIWV